MRGVGTREVKAGDNSGLLGMTPASARPEKLDSFPNSLTTRPRWGLHEALHQHFDLVQRRGDIVQNELPPDHVGVAAVCRQALAEIARDFGGSNLWWQR